MLEMFIALFHHKEQYRFSVPVQVIVLLKNFMTCHIFSLFREVMSHPVTVLQTREKVGKVVDILRTESHNGFPVVQDYTPSSHKVRLPILQRGVKKLANCKCVVLFLMFRRK